MLETAKFHEKRHLAALPFEKSSPHLQQRPLQTPSNPDEDICL